MRYLKKVADLVLRYFRTPNLRDVPDRDKMALTNCDPDRLWMCRMRYAAFVWLGERGWICVLDEPPGLLSVSNDLRATIDSFYH
jgi:hypothetical protein